MVGIEIIPVAENNGEIRYPSMTPSDDHPAPQAYVLSFRCPDRLGVVERYSGVLYGCGAYITEVSNYTDPATAMFFLRCVFDDRVMTVPPAEFGERLKVLAEELGMEYTLRPADEKPRVVLAVSRFDHCLSALLTKWRSGALPANIVAVVSSHDDCPDSRAPNPITRPTSVA